MNRKGFTLVEMLAVIVILGLIMGIATYGVIGAINSSKNRGEKLFLDRLTTIVDEYISLSNSSSTYSITKSTNTNEFCIRNCEEDKKVYLKEYGTFNIEKLVDANLIEKDKLVNPKNKLACFDLNNENDEIHLYRDTDYVYYYYIDLTNNKCELNAENTLITNFTEKVIDSLNENDGFNNLGIPTDIQEKINTKQGEEWKKTF